MAFIFGILLPKRAVNQDNKLKYCFCAKIQGEFYAGMEMIASSVRVLIGTAAASSFHPSFAAVALYRRKQLHLPRGFTSSRGNRGSPTAAIFLARIVLSPFLYFTWTPCWVRTLMSLSTALASP